jgi:hypothetical protein
MPIDENKDPITGKGEEMIPDRGLPFDLPQDETDETVEPILEENINQPETDLLPSEATPEGSAFPEDVETDTLIDFFDSVSADYSPVMDNLDEVEESVSDELASPPIIRSPYSSEAEITANVSPEAEPELEEMSADESQPDRPLVNENLSPWDGSDDDLSSLTGEGEAILGISDEFTESFLGDGEIPFAPPDELEASVLGKDDHPFEEKPPAEALDEGMGTAFEEAYAAEEVSPNLIDEGMSAGYPPSPEETLTIPTEPIAQPEPVSVSWAPPISPPAPQPTPESINGDETGHHDHAHPEEHPAEISPEAGPQHGPTDKQTITHDHGRGHPAKPEIIERLKLEDKSDELWIKADKIQPQVNEYISDLNVAQKMLDYIQTARNEMMGGVENYEDAERYLNEVEFRVALNKRLKDLSKAFVFGLFAYEILWAVGLVLVLIIGLGASVAFASKPIADTSIGAYLMGSIIWGGFGGAIGALLALIKHIAVEQDFDKQHTWWYYSSPPIGLGIGAVVFLFMMVGLYAIIGADGKISSPAVIYAFSWLAGYQHNVFTSLVKRMMKTLLGEQKEEETEEKEMATLDNETK